MNVPKRGVWHTVGIPGSGLSCRAMMPHNGADRSQPGLIAKAFGRLVKACATLGLIAFALCMIPIAYAVVRIATTDNR